MVVLLHKGTWQYQNPKICVLLVNQLNALFKKVFGEIGLVSFLFFPDYP